MCTGKEKSLCKTFQKPLKAEEPSEVVGGGEPGGEVYGLPGGTRDVRGPLPGW